jgi:hypothetical protein
MASDAKNVALVQDVVRDGQDAASEEPFPSWPVYAEDEIAVVNAVLRSGRVNTWTGEHVMRFAAAYADHCGVRHGVAVANGSVALELALVGLGIGPGHEVVVTPRTFIASASSVVLRGATPVFADVDFESQNITAETIRPVLSDRTRAIIAVHLAGWPCDMEAIGALARERNLVIIEDCAQAHGARLHGRPVGQWGDAAAFSFCTDKIISTGGEGGMLVTDRTDVWRRAWAYKDHGRDFSAVFERTHPPGYRWVCESFGSNWRLTEMQAAIGRLQLAKLPGWLAQRRANAAVLKARCQDMSLLRTPEPPPGVEHAYYKFDTFIRPERLRSGWDQDRIVAALEARGIPCRYGPCSEIYREQAFIAAGLTLAKRLPVARMLGQTGLQFPVHPTLNEQHMMRMADAIHAVCTEASN